MSSQTYSLENMPGINPKLLDSVVYAYPSLDSAREGGSGGGTGFIASVPYREGKGEHCYVVSNYHVVRNGAVIRINLRGGGLIYVEMERGQWETHAEMDDVAVAPFVPSADMRIGSVPRDQFIPRDHTGIGPGNDAFFLSRFAMHPGRYENQPVVRFGTVAAMPLEPIQLPTGIRQEAFLVEAHSLGGHSGSPVFASPYPWSALVQPAQWVAAAKLLGIDWGHLDDIRPVLGDDLRAVSPGLSVKQNSGMMGVVPAWKIAEVIDSDELAVRRQEVES